MNSVVVVFFFSSVDTHTKWTETFEKFSMVDLLL